MATRNGTPRLYRQDMVRRLAAKPRSSDADAAAAAGDEKELGVIVRTWHEEADHIADGASPDEVNEWKDLDRPLKVGEVGVYWQSSGAREILREDSVLLCDRLLAVGDIVKRSLADDQSGVITTTSTECTLMHSITRTLIHNVPGHTVTTLRGYQAGDHVIYNDWFGVIEEVLVETLWITHTGRVFRTYDTASDYQVGVARVNPWETDGGEYVRIKHPANPPLEQLEGQTAISIDVTHRAAWVNWLVVNQTLSSSEQAESQPAQIYWAEDIDQLVLVKPMLGAALSVGDRVVHRDPDELWKHVRQQDIAELRKASPRFPGFDVTRFPNERECVVYETKMKVTVKWQDGSLSEEDSTALVPYSDLIDPHEAWPGEMVSWRPQGGDGGEDSGEDSTTEGKLVVVQSFNSEERTAMVAAFGADSGSGSGSAGPEEVPALELDVFGYSPEGEESFWQHGLRRGDDVLIGRHDDGVALPRIPRLGAPAKVEGDWLAPFEAVAQAFLDKYPSIEGVPTLSPRLSTDLSDAEKSRLAWCGVVVDLELDGRAKVLLANGDTLLVSPANVSKIDDHFGHQDWVVESDDRSVYEHPMDLEEDVKWMTEDGQEVVDEDMDDWESDDEGGGDKARSRSDAHTEPPTSATTAAPSASAPAPKIVSYALNSAAPPLPAAEWVLFDIQEEVPCDHYYANKPPQEQSRAFYSRLHKEHKSLRSALPANILVRGYANRLDLLRVLIFGSPGTPYAEGAFLFDFYLEDFPDSPPQGYFHHWINGPRISPNLYENGKICLSLLGTWSGESSESWQPAKSSLLQLFVSIASLVLVDEPYYTEPAFERLKATEEGRVNARLFKESALVSTLGHVRRALMRPPKGFEDEVKCYYLGTSAGEGSGERRGGRLSSLIADSERLIAISRQVKEDRKAVGAEAGAPPVTYAITGTSIEPLSGGAMIVLERGLKPLRALVG
ncbi:unnamed protein product [Parajaminaea phylloscopi]